jgi:hypothetical protein
MALFIPTGGVFNPSMQHWDAWQHPNDRVVMYRQLLDVLGSLCRVMGRYTKEYNSDRDLLNIATVTVVPHRRSTTPAGFLILVSHSGLPEDDDDLREKVKPGTNEMTPVAFSALATRRATRDPEWILLNRLCLNIEEEHVSGVASKSHRAKPKPPGCWFEAMTRDQYYRLALAYRDDRASTTDLMRVTDVTDDKNPANPYNLFTLEFACKLAERAGANIHYTKETNYITTTRHTKSKCCSFPEKGKTTYRVYMRDLDPILLPTYLFPHVPRRVIPDDDPALLQIARDKGHPFDKDALERARISLQMESITVESDDTFNGLKAKVAPVMNAFDDRAEEIKKRIKGTAMRRLTTAIKASYMRKRTEVKRNTRDTVVQSVELRILAKEERKVLYTTPIELTEEEADELHSELEVIGNERYTKQKEFLECFFRIFSPHGRCSDSTKAICAWHDDFIRKQPNHSMSLPSKPLYDNLTSFGNEMVTFITGLEDLYKVHNSHAHITTVAISSLHLYADSKLHPNCLLLGGPGTGKSYALEIVHDISIPGIVRYQDSSSSLADAVNDNSEATDKIINTEEGQPSKMGVNPNGSSNSMSTDDSSRLRSQMTSQVLRHVRLEKDQATGTFVNKII